jgi:processing peptidase subunit alpha
VGPARPASAYTGGDVRSSPDWNSQPATIAAATAKTDFSHVILAFPTVGWSDDDVVPVCVVDTLLGGGASFSAGGPGKGMYSRLYREVLNAHAWVESANAFSAQLYDSGLVGIYGSAAPEHAGGLTQIMMAHLLRLTEEPVRATELARARNQLAGSVMMNLETRGLLCEDIGRQILSHGKRMPPTELLRRIQAVTPQDITRVMRKALSAAPSFAAVGDLSELPEYRIIRDIFAERKIQMEQSDRASILPNAR